jgi:hypothetical protein
MADLQRVNGNLISWGSMTLKLGQERWTGVSEVSYGDKTELAKGYGSAPHQGPRGRSRGKYVPEAVKLKMFSDSAVELRRKLAALSADARSYGTVTFDGEVQFAEADLPAQQVTLVGLRVTSDMTTASEGSEPVMVDIECDCMWVVRDGLTMFDSSQGYPSAG